jgi:hypothetical protein
MAQNVIHGVAEVSFTSGTGSYVVSGALANSYRFLDKLSDGASNLLIEVTDSSKVEYTKATFTAPNILTRDLIVSSSNSDDSEIDWPATGQRIIRLILDFDSGLPIGGDQGDQLRKASLTNYDARWELSPYPIAMFWPGNMVGGGDDDRMRIRVLVTESVMFFTNFLGSYGTGRIASAGLTTIVVNRISNQSVNQIGSVVWGAGDYDGVFTTSDNIVQRLNAGQIIEVLGPVTPDNTLSDINITFRSRRL